MRGPLVYGSALNDYIWHNNYLNNSKTQVDGDARSARIRERIKRLYMAK